MKFWKNNRVDQEHDVSAHLVRTAFLHSDEFSRWQAGANFESCLAIFLTDNYGSYEPTDFKKLCGFIFRTWESELQREAVLSFLIQRR